MLMTLSDHCRLSYFQSVAAVARVVIHAAEGVQVVAYFVVAVEVAEVAEVVIVAAAGLEVVMVVVVPEVATVGNLFLERKSYLE